MDGIIDLGLVLPGYSLAKFLTQKANEINIDEIAVLPNLLATGINSIYYT